MDKMDEFLLRVRLAIARGQVEEAGRGIEAALERGVDPILLMDEGVMAGARDLGEAFEIGDVFLPELMLGGRALRASLAVLTPAIQARHPQTEPMTRSRIALATVQTDIHDIGKTAVGAMLTATGFEVIDLGVDVPLKTIVDKALEIDAQMIAVSALLTTSLPYMHDLIDLIVQRGLRDRFRVIVGGAPVTQSFADEIGANGYASDAASAVDKAKELLNLA